IEESQPIVLAVQMEVGGTEVTVAETPTERRFGQGRKPRSQLLCQRPQELPVVWPVLQQRLQRAQRAIEQLLPIEAHRRGGEVVGDFVQVSQDAADATAPPFIE